MIQSKFLKLTTPIQVGIVLLCVVLFGNLLPVNFQAFLYAISLTLEDITLFILPVLIFSCSFLSLSEVHDKKSIGLILVILFTIVCVSNYVATFIAYGVISLKLIDINISSVGVINNTKLEALWHISLPKWIPFNYALLGGFTVGGVSSFVPLQIKNKLNISARHIVDFFLKQFFIKILPVFVLGFLIKMEFDGILSQTIKYCLPLLLLLSITYILYLAFLFAVVANFNFQTWIKYIKNVIPVVVTGFSTMSSLLTMPLTINAAEQNTNDPNIARLVIPITANVHMVGLAINIPMIALSMLLGFGYELPTFGTYSIFALYFVLTQFAGAGVPGCGILLMIPLLETYLGFTNEMSALIIIIYVLFDATETSANVLGNSVLVIAISKIYKALNSKCTKYMELRKNINIEVL